MRTERGHCMKKIIIAGCVGAGCVFSGQADLIHRYVFSNNVNDVVGSANGTASAAGTVLGAPTYVTAAPTGAVSGAPTKSLVVTDGNSDKKSFFSLPLAAGNVPKGTLSFWFKPEGLPADNIDRILNAKGGTTGLALLPFAAGTVQSTIYNTQKTMTLSGATTDWHFYSATWDDPAGTATVYIDGGVHNYSFTANTFDLGTIIFGTFSTADTTANQANQWSGSYWDVQIYDTALSSTDINTLKSNPGSVIPEPATIGMLMLGAGITMGLRHKLHF